MVEWLHMLISSAFTALLIVWRWDDEIGILMNDRFLSLISLLSLSFAYKLDQTLSKILVCSRPGPKVEMWT